MATVQVSRFGSASIPISVTVDTTGGGTATRELALCRYDALPADVCEMPHYHRMALIFRGSLFS